ncbi:MAG: OmpH family outer membrane protein [Armatimonadota bacterium]
MKKIVIVAAVLFICMGIIISVTGCKPANLKTGIINRYKLLANWAEYRDLMSEYQVESDLLLGKLPKDPSKITDKQKAVIEQMNEKWKEKGNALDEKLEEVVAQIAKKKKLNIVVVDFAVEYGGIDITDEIKNKLQ